MATLIKTDGTLETVYPKNGKDWKLKELQEMVGGMIEIAYPKRYRMNLDTNILVIDEEGKLKEKKVNVIATIIYGASDDNIVGDALLCKNEEIE